MIIPNLKPLFLKAFQNWQKDNAPRHAAAFSFYAMLSLSPMLVLAVAVASKILGDSQAGMHIVHVAEGYLGKQGSKFLESLIATSAKPGASAIATVLSIGVAVYGAINLFQQLSDSISYIWKAKQPRGGFKGFLLGKVIAVAMFIIFSAIFILWLALDSWIGWMEAHTPGFQGWQFVSFFVSVLFLSLAFALIFRAMPKGMVAWGDVWIGAITTATGFGVSKFLLSMYFSYSTTSAAYGSAGALVIVLLWIYYSAQIFFFGIELTCTYAHIHGSQINRHRGDPPIPVPAHT
jgi:membrane protein